MSNERNGVSWGPVIIASAVGLAVGAAIGLLFAPQSGKETRKMIVDKASEMGDRAAEFGTNVRDSAAEAVKRMRRTTAETMEKTAEVVGRKAEET